MAFSTPSAFRLSVKVSFVLLVCLLSPCKYTLFLSVFVVPLVVTSFAFVSFSVRLFSVRFASSKSETFAIKSLLVPVMVDLTPLMS